MDLRNTHKEKFWTHKVPTIKNFRPAKYPQQKMLDPPSTYNPQSTHHKIFRAHDVTTIKTFGPTKYPWETFFDPQSTHDKKFWRHEIPTRKTIWPQVPKRKRFGPKILMKFVLQWIKLLQLLVQIIILHPNVWKYEAKPRLWKAMHNVNSPLSITKLIVLWKPLIRLFQTKALRNYSRQHRVLAEWASF